MAASADLIIEANQCLLAKLVDHFNGDISPTKPISFSLDSNNNSYIHITQSCSMI